MTILSAELDVTMVTKLKNATKLFYDISYIVRILV